LDFKKLRISVCEIFSSFAIWKIRVLAMN